MFCLPKELVQKFLDKLPKDLAGIEKLSEMSSEERRAYFSESVGESNAKAVNALFESKLLLKNQQLGIINWAKSVTGMKPEVLRDILSKVSRMTEILQPKELDSFLSDLAAHKLGFGVTMEEAAKISQLAQQADSAKTALDNGGDRLAYGRAKVEFGNYVSDLKNSVPKERTVGSVLSDVAGTSKALKASMDNSAIFRQGWKTMFTTPRIWLNNARQSFVNIWKTFGKDQVMNELNADIHSRPNALNGYYKKSGLALSTIEESFPTSLPEKVPVLGRIYKASENAFTAFVYKTRADVFDKYIEIAQKSGIDLSDPVQLKSIGNLVNSLTGRGNLGRAEPAAGLVNNIFFSPRKLKADFDFLTAHQFQKEVTPFVRKQAAINLVKVISGTAAILTIANALKPGSVEKNSTSADWGKIRIGDTRFDVTGGMGSLVVLASRLATMSSKSSTTGKVTPLNSGKFGSQTGVDVVINFFENKLSPASSIVKDLLKGQDFNGKKPTVLGEANNLLTPLPITTGVELLQNPKSANFVLSMLADSLGISVNTYSKKKK